MNCKYCGKPLPPSGLKKNATDCSACQKRRREIRKFIEACDEFKKIINYEAILKKREREAKINSERAI